MISYLDELLASMIATIQRIGWPIVFSLIAIYILQPQIQSFRSWLSFRRANEPGRVSILNEERQRVRLQQQLDMKRNRTSKSETLS